MVELRHYTLHPGRRPDLLRVFEGRLIEPQEQVGMTVGGLFLDERDQDSFFWLRGFADQEARTEALEAFYGGPVWAAHRDEANATMMDSDDVLVLRPTVPPHPPAKAVERPGPDAEPSGVRFHLGIYQHQGKGDVETWLSEDVHVLLERLLGVRVAAWRTDPFPNGFPRLPVRAGRYFVWLAGFTDDVSRHESMSRLRGSAEWQHNLEPRLIDRLTDRDDASLAPAARSAHPQTDTGTSSTL